MTLKTRLKRAFTRGSSADGEGVSLGKLSSRSSKKSQPMPDPNVYQPGEKMPPMKYRRPVDPAHKAHLESFSWTSAWRRRSVGSVYSVYSPMGSRLPSRKASRTTLGRKSIGARSIGGRSRKSFGAASQRSLRGRGISTRDLDEEAVDSGFGGSVFGDDMDQHPDIREGSDEEGDITNVGLSRNPTEDPRDARNRRKSSNKDLRSQAKSPERPMTAEAARPSSRPPPNDQPFSQEDLEAALRKSRLEDMTEESESKNPSGHHTPLDAASTPRQVPVDP